VLLSLWAEPLQVDKEQRTGKEIKDKPELENDVLKIKYLAFMEVDVIPDLFTKFEKMFNSDLAPFMKYFKTSYIKANSLESWNYHSVNNNRTTNCVESYNNLLSKFFNNKPNLFHLLYQLRLEERNIVKQYD